MKRLVFLISVLAMTLAWAAPAQAAWRGYVTTDINMRSGPGVRYRVKAVIPRGDPVLVRKCRTRWCNVRWHGVRGWVSRRFIVSARQRETYYDDEIYYPPYYDDEPIYIPRRYYKKRKNKYRKRKHRSRKYNPRRTKKRRSSKRRKYSRKDRSRRIERRPRVKKSTRRSDRTQRSDRRIRSNTRVERRSRVQRVHREGRKAQVRNEPEVVRSNRGSSRGGEFRRRQR